MSYKLQLLHRLCPDPSSIQVDSSGQPIGVTFGGNFLQRPEFAVGPMAIPPAETALASQGMIQGTKYMLVHTSQFATHRNSGLSLLSWHVLWSGLFLWCYPALDAVAYPLLSDDDQEM